MASVIYLLFSLVTLGFIASTVYFIRRHQKQITDFKKENEILQDDLLYYALSNPNPILGVDKAGKILFANHGAENILSVWEIGLHDKIPAEWREVVRQVILSRNAQTLELNLEQQSYLLTIVPRQSEIVSLFGTDITSLKTTEQQLEDKILNDDETKLPNRVSFRRILENTMQDTKAHNVKLGLLILRLDDYFQILNTYGEEISQNIILELVQRLSSITHKNSVVARLSDNEFSIIEPYMTSVSQMSNYVENIIEVCTQPYRIAGRDIFVSISIGIAYYPSDGETTEVLLRCAQLAVNRTTNTHNPYEFFQRGMEEQLALKRATIADIHIALEQNQFELHYQPQIDIIEGKLAGCESLIRWNHPTKGYISPFYFITAAEESNLIERIGEWTLKVACDQIVKWREQGLTPFKVSVNVSARQILKTDVMAIVKKLMDDNQITSDWLALELTESALVQDKDYAQKVLENLKSLGLQIALDDFGTGYSSLSYLKQFPIDKIKIDRSFIKDIKDETEEHAVTKGIIDLGHSLKLHMIAEGVEEPGQLRFLLNNGCEIIQGYIFGKAVSAEDFMSFYKTDWKKVIAEKQVSAS